MQAPETPKNEDERLETLHNLNILNTPFEERFDRYTRLAASMFDMPIALISLVDKHRQWFKSSCGLDTRFTARNVSVCGHTILQDDVLVIQDLAQDERFSDNPLVTAGPKIRFYAGAPLKAINGHKLGSFCIIDYEPRTFTEKNKADLNDFASLVSDEIFAYTDKVTGLTNRHGFNFAADNLLNAVSKGNGSMHLLMLDIDRFSDINANYGYSAGDKALSSLALSLQQVCKEDDLIARFGDDEFCVLIPNKDEAEILGYLKNLYDLIAIENNNNDTNYHLDFCFGVTKFDQAENNTIEKLLILAYQAVHQEKIAKRL